MDRNTVPEAKSGLSARAEARRKIIQAANRQRLRNPARTALKLYSARQLQQCVRVCRHWGLVSADVLEAAGFRP